MTIFQEGNQDKKKKKNDQTHNLKWRFDFPQVAVTPLLAQPLDTIKEELTRLIEVTGRLAA